MFQGRGGNAIRVTGQGAAGSVSETKGCSRSWGAVAVHHASPRFAELVRSWKHGPRGTITPGRGWNRGRMSSLPMERATGARTPRTRVACARDAKPARSEETRQAKSCSWTWCALLLTVRARRRQRYLCIRFGRRSQRGWSRTAPEAFIVKVVRILAFGEKKRNQNESRC